jgi:hypothetical protein
LALKHQIITQKGKKMENQIVCPSCRKAFLDSEIIRDAAAGKGPFKRHMMCECGEKITYWQITAQLRDHHTLVWRFRNWIKSLLTNRGL